MDAVSWKSGSCTAGDPRKPRFTVLDIQSPARTMRKIIADAEEKVQRSRGTYTRRAVMVTPIKKRGSMGWD
jgi:hypothetical protein